MPLFRRKRKDEPPIDPEDISPLTGVKYKDLGVVDQLVKAGADLTQPRHVLYYLYFASVDIAGAAAREARQRSFEASVRQPLPGHPPQWSVVCEASGIVLDVDTIRDNTEFFETLARRHRGEYDGWEASVT